MHQRVTTICTAILFPLLLSGCLSLTNGSSTQYLVKEQYRYEIGFDEEEPFNSELVVTLKRNRPNPQVLILKRTTQIDSYSELSIESDDQLLFESDGNGLSIDLICLQPNDQLAIELSGHYGGNQGPFKTVAREAASGEEWSYIELTDDQTGKKQSSATNCSDNLAHELDAFKDYQPITLCECDYSEFEREADNVAELDSFIPDTGGELGLDPVLQQRVFDLELTPILRSSVTFDQSITRFKESFSVTEFSTPAFQFMQVSRLDAPAFSNFSYSFILLNKQWFLLYSAPVSSKATHPLQGLRIIDNYQLAIDEICVENCDWWGSYASAIIDLKNLSITYFTDESPH